MVSRPSDASVANFFRLSLLNVPLFSPFCSRKILSEYSQNLPCSAAHSEAFAAYCDSFPMNANCL